MGPVRLSAFMLLLGGLILGLCPPAIAQITFTESGTGGCISNSTSGHTDCASATFSLMTGGSGGSAGTVISGTSASNVTGLQIVIRNTTPTTLTSYQNADLLTGFFWGLNGNPTLATTGSGKNQYFNGSALASNSTGGNAILNPSQCSSVAVCTGKSINVGAYWEASYKVGGWSGTGLTFGGAYAVSTSGYSSVSLGNGTKIGASDPTLVSNGNSSLNFGMVGGAGSTPTVGNLPAVQDTVTIQLAFASAISTFNLNSDIVASQVYFTYGTAPEVAGSAKKAPEPASIALLTVGVLGLGWARRCSRREASA